MTFGEALKRYRLEKGWTLRQVSALTGYPTATLSRIEIGRVEPHDLTKAKIRKALPFFADAEDVSDPIAAAYSGPDRRSGADRRES